MPARSHATSPLAKILAQIADQMTELVDELPAGDPDAEAAIGELADRAAREAYRRPPGQVR